jgi:hypothetical protein
MTLVTGTAIGDAIVTAVDAINPMTTAQQTTLKSYWEPIAAAIMATGAGGFTSYNIVSVSCAHGVQSSVAHGMPSAPTLAVVLGCTGGLSVMGSPVLADLGSGNLGVTVLYTVPENYIQLIVRSAVQTFTTGIVTVATWDSSANQQVGSGIVYTSSTASLAPSIAGRYLITATQQFAGGGTGGRFASIVQNGSVRLTSSSFSPGDANSGSCFSLSTISNFNAGDTAVLEMYQDSGGNLNSVVGAPNFPLMQMTQLSNTSAISGTVTLMLLKQ